MTPSTSRGAQLLMDGRTEVGSFRVDVSVRAAPGRVLALLGPNGSGKSTVLRALCGLTPLSAGRIRLGTDVWDDPDAGVYVQPESRPVGVVFQDLRLFPHLSVLDNVAFPVHARGTGRRAARSQAGLVLERTGIGELARRRPWQLSGGQAQRVALARALAAQPRVLLLDEPFAALDARTRGEVRAELGAVIRDFAGPVIMVTHDPVDAMVLADELVVIEGGRVVQAGSPTDVSSRPATEYVARLVGLNVFRGVVESDSRTVFLDGGGSFVAPLGDVPPGARVLVAVRPSAITVLVHRPADASPRNVWPGTIARMESLGDRVRLDVTGAPPARVDVTAAAVAELRLGPGQHIWLSAKATEVDVYPADTAAASP